MAVYESLICDLFGVETIKRSAMLPGSPTQGAITFVVDFRSSTFPIKTMPAKDDMIFSFNSAS